MNGAKALVECLKLENVECVFGYPGAVICPVFDALYDTDIKVILCRQEQNAAHEASGYTRISGKPAVAIATSGPGALNLMSGIATAYADSIPIVCITGQVDSKLMGTDGFQETDVVGAVESYVKYSYIVEDTEDIPRIMKEAFYIARSGRPGPVLIDLPFDMQTNEISAFSYEEKIKIRSYKPTVNGHPLQMRRVLEALKTAKKPLVIAGGGIHLGNAVPVFREFIEKYRIPIVSTMMGISVLPTEHPLNFGMVGNNGHPFANKAAREADLIIMAGARVADRTIRDPALIEKKLLVHIDVDPAEIGKNAGPAIPLVGDIRHILQDFCEREPEVYYRDWTSYLVEARAEWMRLFKAREIPRGIDPERFMRALSQAMEKDAVYVADVGQNQLWSCAYVVIREGRFITCGGMGTMGYALPAAIGAKIGCPKKQVVAVCGDGSFQMSMMELASARQHKVPIKLVVIKNGTLGLVYQYQHFHHEGRSCATILDGDPDLSGIAAAYGMDFLKLYKGADTDRLIGEFLRYPERSTILECDVDPDCLA
ncbi:MAG: biosynthetic-type acetolactate synthase large subunit [Lachnospiraceae bacterium]|nr:biosynthetic-type acetolactate synthase large subunit [Lachnospiraceae bacterium]